MRHDSSPDLVAADVREQRIIGPEGAEEVHRSVHCELRGSSVRLELCSQCPRRVELRSDAVGRPLRLVCRMPELDGMADAGTELGLDAKVTEVMSTKVICVKAELSVRSVLMVMVEQGIGGAPVVDAAGRPVGFISMTDLLREQYEQLDEEEDDLLPSMARDAIAQRHGEEHHAKTSPSVTAAEVMTPSIFALPESARVRDVVLKMAQHRVQRIAVVAEDGKLVGIVSSSDVVRHLAKGLKAQ